MAYLPAEDESALGMVDAAGVPSPGTKWVGPAPEAIPFYDAQGNYAGSRQPLDAQGNPVPDSRPIAIPSYLWGGTGGRPVYVLGGPDEWRPDLYRYDADGVMKFESTEPLSEGGGIIPVDPPNVKTVGELNPIVVTASGQTVAAAQSANATVSSAARTSLLVTLALALFMPRR